MLLLIITTTATTTITIITAVPIAQLRQLLASLYKSVARVSGNRIC